MFTTYYLYSDRITDICTSTRARLFGTSTRNIDIYYDCKNGRDHWQYQTMDTTVDITVSDGDQFTAVWYLPDGDLFGFIGTSTEVLQLL